MTTMTSTEPAVKLGATVSTRTPMWVFGCHLAEPGPLPPGIHMGRKVQSGHRARNQMCNTGILTTRVNYPFLKYF